MSAHQASAVRRNGGGRIWHPVCPNGCTLDGGGKEGAETVAADHARLASVRLIAEGMDCRCGFDYDADSLEWAPDQEPCAKCELLDLLGGAA